MTLTHDYMLRVEAVLGLSVIFLFVAFLIVGGTKGFIRVLKKNVFLIVGLALVAMDLSLLVNFTRYSGEGILIVYGWPHSFGGHWHSFDYTATYGGYLFPYALINLIFYMSVFTLVFSINEIRHRVRQRSR